MADRIKSYQEQQAIDAARQAAISINIERETREIQKATEPERVRAAVKLYHEKGWHEAADALESTLPKDSTT